MPELKKKAIFVFCFFFVTILLACLPEAHSQAEKTGKVSDVRVRGNSSISSSTILSKIRTQPGEVYSQEVANDDIKRLYALGYFTDVVIDIQDSPEGVIVTIIVEEKPLVTSIVFEGNRELKENRLKKTMQTKVGDMLNYSTLAEDVASLKSLYEKNGFTDTAITYTIEKEPEHNQAVVHIKVKESQRMRIKKVIIEGNKSVKQKEIRDVMKTRTAWFFNRGYFDELMFQDDLARIKAIYQDKGFLDVKIEPGFEHDETQSFIFITLKINEGRQYHIENIKFDGNLIFPEEDIRKKLTIKTGEPFSFTQLRESMESIRSLYYQSGYMNADVIVDRMIDPQTSNLNILFTINAKNIVTIGKIDIKGNTKTKDIIIRRELRAFPGEPFDGESLRRSKERLYNLGFFEDIYFETKPTADPNIDDLEIIVKETKTGEFSFGGGYSSIDQFIGFCQVTQKNFDLLNFPYFTGDGQHLALRAELGMTKNNFDISWTEPWILDYPLSFGFDGYYKTQYRETHVGFGYEEQRLGGDVRFGKEFLEYAQANLMYRAERIKISDVPEEASQDFKDEEGTNWISSLILGLRYDRRDNIYSPTKGFIVGTSIENTGGFLFGDKNFYKGYFYANWYFSIIKKVVLEVKGNAGLANAYGKTKKVPIYERFYAGGANTIRGYRERKVGPRDPLSNDPIGGESMMLGTAEVTFPVYEKLIKGAIFFDTGNVWEEFGQFFKGGFKSGAGLGVRVKTPIGPLKLDWGYPLADNQDDKKEGQFYFSVSHGW
ncbi:MAG: outer membrane protein assembly factor BamA [Candidatus Omnitrophica bacterium]|nr:outer membrane protein assembly factor BamA [Candidatus Omnitrophota bacterium]